MIRSEEFKQGYINCVADYKEFNIKYCREKFEEMAPEDDMTKGYEDALESLGKDKFRIYTKRRTSSYK